MKLVKFQIRLLISYKLLNEGLKIQFCNNNKNPHVLQEVAKTRFKSAMLNVYVGTIQTNCILLAFKV